MLAIRWRVVFIKKFFKKFFFFSFGLRCVLSCVRTFAWRWNWTVLVGTIWKQNTKKWIWFTGNPHNTFCSGVRTSNGGGGFCCVCVESTSMWHSGMLIVVHEESNVTERRKNVCVWYIQMVVWTHTHAISYHLVERTF